MTQPDIWKTPSDTVQLLAIITKIWLSIVVSSIGEVSMNKVAVSMQMMSDHCTQSSLHQVDMVTI